VSDPELLPPGTPIDLDNCAREPIHVPGSVQPRGVLLVVQEPGLAVTQVSANIAAILAVRPEDVLGQPLAAVVGTGPAELLSRTAAGFGDLRERNPVEVEIDVNGALVAFDAILHRESADLLLVELEQAFGPRPFSFPNTYLAVRGTVSELNRAASLTDLYDITARAVHELTGFDRVMVYRYDAEYNGEVVAEDKRAELNSFLGLHYPASDIPAQARALYEKNWIRLISDVGYTPSPLVPVANPITGRPLDLTYATLRSVSPIHIEYLKNMGVTASMSISLLRDGKLWGLIACHHYSGPHVPPYGTRTAAEFLGSTLSLRLIDRVEDEELRGGLASQAVLAKLTAAIQDELTPIEASLLRGPDVFDLIAADGVALNIDGRLAFRGAVPDHDQLADIAEWVVSQDEPIVATDTLRRTAGHIDVDPTEVSGLLAAVLRDGQYIIWFRREAERSVDWGGDPYNKAIAVQEGDTVRLSPRKSFDRWREVVRERSIAWTPGERANAVSLRQRVVEVLYARAEREVRLAATLQRSLLPVLPEVRGWGLSAHYEPAAGGRIGGDWYDAFWMRDGRLAVALGDVAGHGISAAGTMAQLRNALRAYVSDGATPAEATGRLNRFCTLLLPGAFATVTVALIDVKTGSLNAVVAGHPMPLVVSTDGSARPAPFVTSPPIGVPGVRHESVDFELAPGEGLVLFSDGLIERRDEDLTDGFARLAAAVGQLGAGLTAESVYNSVVAAPVADDATVLVLRRPST
jgi:chemotaxis family two-component system sensor kinase Cph1